MKNSDITHTRLFNQQISKNEFENPSDVVAWLGAVQAQDYLGGLWAVGSRAKNVTEKDVEKAIADKTIVRTWPLRRTLHFVAAADIRWMLNLLKPHVIAGNATRLQSFGLDDATVTRSKKVFARALQGSKQLSRNAMYQKLETAGISATGGRGLHILAHLSQDGFICFGAREGKQQTFALLDEWVPETKTLERDESLAELARRYFTSHGPATLQDFVWWSGLRVGDAKAAIEMSKPKLVHEIIEGKTYWLASSVRVIKEKSPTAHLLPVYDEYTVAYKDRSATLAPIYFEQTGNGLGSVIILDGHVVGIWKRELKKETVVISPEIFVELGKAEKAALDKAVNRYGKFLDTSAIIS